MIVSLTRSNPNYDIGFMFSPERVNVMLSRARNAFIMIGNVNTFMNARKGKEVWTPLLNKLRKDGHIYEGFPVKCERHPKKIALLVCYVFTLNYTFIYEFGRRNYLKTSTTKHQMAVAENLGKHLR